MYTGLSKGGLRRQTEISFPVSCRAASFTFSPHELTQDSELLLRLRSYGDRKLTKRMGERWRHVPPVTFYNQSRKASASGASDNGHRGGRNDKGRPRETWPLPCVQRPTSSLGTFLSYKDIQYLLILFFMISVKPNMLLYIVYAVCVTWGGDKDETDR